MSNRFTGVNRFIKGSVIAALSMVLIVGCSSQAEVTQGEESDTQQEIHTVKVAPITKVMISEPIEQVADVIASAQVDMMSKATADVVGIVKERGETVEKGEIVLELDTTDVQLQRQQALLGYEIAKQSLSTGKKEWQHTVAKMEQMLSEATKTYNKMKNDYDLGIVEKSQLDQAENAYINARNDLALLKEKSVSALELQVQSAELSLEMSDRSLNLHEIKAPISGIITDLPVQAGMTLPAGFRVGQIQQLDPIKIKALLTAESSNLIRGKEQLEFYVPGNTQMYTGQVTYLSDVIDSQTNAYELNLSVGNSDLTLKPGMKVQVRLTSEEEQEVVAVPTLSIVKEGADSYVYVLNGERAEKRKVELGRLNNLDQEIISGIKEGELLIVSGQHQLNDGDQVKKETAESTQQQ